MAVFSKDLGVDLGTMFTRIVAGDKLVLEEPTVVAIAVDEQKIVSVGEEAKTMLGRVPESIEVARPMQNGVIADYEITEKFLEYLIRKVSGSNRFFRPKVMITVPFGVTSVESRAVHEAILQAGTREAFLVQQPLAAALGIDLPIGTPSGNMVLCLGAGTTQAAVLAMYGIVAAESLRMGGMQLDEAIVSYVRKKYGLIIGSATAEQVKLKLGTAIRQEEEKSIEIQAQDQVSGLPRPLNLTNDDILEALTDPLKRFVELIA
jgi:rod shape-determining protein MreB